MGRESWNSHQRSRSRVGYGLGWHSGTNGHLFPCISLCCSCPKTPLPCSGPSRSLSSPSHSNLLKIWSTCTLLISLSPLYNSQLMAPAFSSQLNWWFLNWGRWGCFLYLFAHLAPLITPSFLKFSAPQASLAQYSPDHPLIIPSRSLLSPFLPPPQGFYSAHCSSHLHTLLLNSHPLSWFTVTRKLHM